MMCARPRPLGNPAPGEVRQTVSLPPHAVSKVIGSKGAVIRELQTESGATIDIQSKRGPDGSNTPCEITGSAAAVKKAVALVNAKIEEANAQVLARQESAEKTAAAQQKSNEEFSASSATGGDGWGGSATEGGAW
jgi:predicted PilT family ATPase